MKSFVVGGVLILLTQTACASQINIGLVSVSPLISADGMIEHAEVVISSDEDVLSLAQFDGSTAAMIGSCLESGASESQRALPSISEHELVPVSDGAEEYHFRTVVSLRPSIANAYAVDFETGRQWDGQYGWPVEYRSLGGCVCLWISTGWYLGARRSNKIELSDLYDAATWIE